MNKQKTADLDSQDQSVNYKMAYYGTDESQVPPYELPDPLIGDDQKRVKDVKEWIKSRRDETLEMFKKYEYGDLLPSPDSISFEPLSQRDDALGGIAIRKEVRIHLKMNNGKRFSFDLLLYTPKNISAPVPAFLGLNFSGNHNTTWELDVAPTGYVAPGELASERSASQTSRWHFAETIRRGYASATLCYQDIHPDRLGSTGDSVFRLFFDEKNDDTILEKYSIIGAWAWGLSRGLDYLAHNPDIDVNRVAVHGHSRLGKTSLWAGVIDPRFRMVISNNSGCGGATLHKRKFGENLSLHFEFHFEKNFPCWFVKAAKDFINKEEAMPFDQHQLLALVAPRPLAVHSATLDLSADPKGEFLACVHASKVYNLFGFEGFPAAEIPEPGVRIDGIISYMNRVGKHDQTPEDWAHYLDLADQYL